MKKEKGISTERTHLFTPNSSVFMKAEIYPDRLQSGTLSIDEKKNLEEKIRKAVLEASYANETLISRMIMDEAGEVYYDKKDRPSYQFHILDEGTDWKTVINDQESIPYHWKQGEMVRYFLIPTETGILIVVMAHHLVGDGKSILVLLSDIMKALNGQPLEYKRVEILNKRDFPKKSKMLWVVRRFVLHLNRMWRKEKTVFDEDDYIRVFDNYWKNRKTSVENLILSEEDTNKVIEVARQANVSVNSLLTTVLIKAYGESVEVGYAIDIRNENQNGMGNYVSGQNLNFSYDVEKSFQDNMQQVHSLYQEKLENIRSKYFTLQFLDAIDNTLIDSACMQMYTDYDSPVSQKLAHLMGYDVEEKGISISNLTRCHFTEAGDAYRMRDLLFVPPIEPYTNRLFGIVTLEGKLGIVLHYHRNEINGNEFFDNIVHELQILTSNN